jgi:hemolysin-activating ACP:hemolysin acyltransferase
MKSPAHKHFSLADLEWLLLPPVALNQFALADAKLPNGQAVLAGFVLWARVAPDVNARLTQTQHYPVRLHPNEWQSGDIFWIIDAVGQRNAVQHCIEVLKTSTFQGKGFKTLTPSNGGHLAATLIDNSASPDPNTACSSMTEDLKH